MQTVLVLDSQSVGPAHKVLDSFDCLTMAVSDVGKARHILLNFDVDLWICDLSTSDLDFRALRIESQNRNPRCRVLLTGPALTQTHAGTLIEEKLAAAFIPKPWPLLNLRHMIVDLLRESPSPAATTSPSEATPRPKRRPIRVINARELKHADGPNTMRLPQDEARYRLDEQLGEGGSGRVYRAFDLLLEMEVAIKLLNPDIARDVEAIRALKQEARICLQLNHKHIVRLYNIEKRAEVYLLIMEYVRVCTLHQLMGQHGALPPLMVLQIATVMVDALGYAHKHGVLHKDLTPGNVLISDDGLLKLIDFGIADVANRQNKDAGYVVGTPVYMSPEQLRGDLLDLRTDVYSLGVLLYQTLTGMLPSRPDTTVEDLAFREHPPLAGAPYPVLQALELATAFNPDRRWPSISHFGAAFTAACVQEYGIRLEDAEIAGHTAS